LDDISGARRGFPTTHLSVVQAAGSDDAEVRRRAFGALVAVYWKPVYVRLRMRWGKDGEAAKDLTQEFFTEAMTRDYFDRYDPGRARFRTFLKSCVDHFAANARRADRRLKRGGGVALLPLDFAGADREFAESGQVALPDVDARFHHEWVRALFTVAVDALRDQSIREGHDLRFRLFERHDLAPAGEDARPSYRALAQEFDLPVTQVTNHLAWARREFRRLVLSRLRELCGSDAEFRVEARELLGSEPE
jgi:DNA-directed RNA polymerase specialized sigma24 family protein